MTQTSKTTVGLVPEQGRVIVQKDVRKGGDKVLESGLILPELGSPPPVSSGTIVAVADDSDRPLGQRVVFSPYSGFAMQIDGEQYLLLADGEILARHGSGEQEVLVR